MIRRSLLALTAAACALAVTAYATFAQQPAPLDGAKLLPAGRTLAFVSLNDVTAVEPAFQATDLGQVWKLFEPFKVELERGFDVSLADMRAQFEQEAGVKFEDALKTIEGGVAAGVVDMAIPEAARPAPAFVVAVSARHKPVLEAVVKKFTPPPGEGPQGPPPFTIVEQGGAALVVTDPGALVGPGGTTLADDPSYRSLKARMIGPGGVGFLTTYINAEGLLGRVARSDPHTAEQLAKAGVLDVKAVGLSLGFDGGRLREAIAIAAPGERHGFMKMLTSEAPLDVAALAANVPADAFSFAAMRFEPRAIVKQAIEVIRTLEPGAAADIEREIADLDRQLGIRLVDDLLGSFGDVLVMETSVPEDGLLPESVIAIGVKDAAKLEKSLAKVAKLGGLEVKAIERGGKTIRYFQAPLGKFGENPAEALGEEKLGIGIVASALVGAYAIDGSTFYVSSLPQALEDRFERMAKGTLAGVPQFKASIEPAPANARMFSWGKTRPAVGVAYDITLRVLRALEPAIRRAGVPVDVALLPRTAAVARPMLPASSALICDGEGLVIVSQGGLPILTAVPIIAAIAIPNVIEHQREAQRAAVMGTLMQLYYAEQEFYTQNSHYAPSFDELVKAGVLETPPLMKGYQLVITRAEGSNLMIEARPLDPSKPHLIVDQTGFVRGYGEPNPFEGEEPSERHEEMPPEAPPGEQAPGEEHEPRPEEGEPKEQE